MVTLPEELLAQAGNGNVLLFVGDHLTQSTAGGYLTNRLPESLAKEAGVPDLEVDHFSEVAQIVQDKQGRNALLDQVRQIYASDTINDIPEAYRLVAQFTRCRIIVTTCVDQRLEQAFFEAERPLKVVVDDNFDAIDLGSQTILFKLHGSIEKGDPLVLTEEDIEHFLEDFHTIPLFLRAYLAHKTLLFLGCDLTDKYFKRYYRKITTGIDGKACPHYIVAQSLSPHLALWCSRVNLIPISAESTPFLHTLMEASIGKRPQEQRTKSVREPRAQRPYKFLDYYEANDTDFFFGRQQETGILSAQIQAHRLVLLYGASGVGKTSLLLAGTGPQFTAADRDYRLIYARALANPKLIIQQAIRRQLPASIRGVADLESPSYLPELRKAINESFNKSELYDLCFDLFIDPENLSGINKQDQIRELVLYCGRHDRLPDLIIACRNLRPHIAWFADIPEERIRILPRLQASFSDDASLTDIIHTASEFLDCTFIIILDQFEEFFIRLSPQFRTAFIEDLGALYDAADVPVKIVLCLREDWLATLGEMEYRFPDLFRIRYRLLPLTRNQAKEAIVRPLEGLDIQYDPALVDELLNQLMDPQQERVLPPQLQLVCSAVYESAYAAGKQIITMSDLDEIDGVPGILRTYLDKELSRLPAVEKELARSLLSELVSSENTRRVVTQSELDTALGASEQLLTELLDKLLKARLLRLVQQDEIGEPGYELAHEYLIHEITITPQLRQRKEAEELLRQGMENWQRYDMLLSEDALAIIESQRYQLRIKPEEKTILQLSTSRHQKRAARVLFSTFWGAIGAFIGAFIYVLVTLRSEDFLNILAATSLAAAGFGMVLGFCLSISNVIVKRRVVATLVAGILVGLVVMFIPILLPKELAPITFERFRFGYGFLLTAGIGACVILGKQLENALQRTLFWFGAGLVVAGTVSILFFGPVIGVLDKGILFYALIGAGSTSGIGLAEERFQNRLLRQRWSGG